jgi:glycosyltransferase involved in cell wall biosynthesis
MIQNYEKIAILITSNTYGGISKLSAMMANDLANKKCKVTIFIPILPYYIFYFKIFKKPFFYIFKLIPEYLKKWLRSNKFCFEDILSKKKLNSNFIEIKFFIIKINEAELKKFSCLILNGISDVFEYKNINIKKKIYLINQIEEIHNGYKKKFENIRKSFKGEMVTHCDFMKKKLSNHLSSVRVVPNPISKEIWKYKNSFNPLVKRKDILIYWKNDHIYNQINEILKIILSKRPETIISLFARSLFGNKKIKELKNKFNLDIFFDQNEKQVAKLYLNHSFLLYPNQYEDFGMPPVEALACGCIPVLKKNTGAASMYSINNFNSLHLTNNKILDTNIIIQKLNNFNELKRLRKNACKNIDQFNPSNYGNKILNNIFNDR